MGSTSIRTERDALKVEKIDMPCDVTLVHAVVDMAEREMLTAGMDRSAILRGLAPLQWLLLQSRGHGLSFGQAIELDNALRCFCGEMEPADSMLKAAIGFLERTDDRVAQVIGDWKNVEETESWNDQADLALRGSGFVESAIAA